jgi:hypothetical protein
MDVQLATTTFDCATPGCLGDAKRAGGVCSECFLRGVDADVTLPDADAVMRDLEPALPKPISPTCRDCGGALDEVGREARRGYGIGRCQACRSKMAYAIGAARKAKLPARPQPNPITANPALAKPQIVETQDLADLAAAFVAVVDRKINAERELAQAELDLAAAFAQVQAAVEASR